MRIFISVTPSIYYSLHFSPHVLLILTRQTESMIQEILAILRCLPHRTYERDSAYWTTLLVHEIRILGVTLHQSPIPVRFAQEKQREGGIESCLIQFKSFNRKFMRSLSPSSNSSERIQEGRIESIQYRKDRILGALV